MQNQDFKKLESDGALLLVGRIEIYFDGKRITELCTLSINDLSERTGIVFNHRDTFIASQIKTGNNRIDSIGCNESVDFSAFTYEISNFEFLAEKQINYFGVIKIYFSDKRGWDGYKKYELTKPSIEKIVLEENKVLLEEILNFFNTKKFSKANIFKSNELH